MQFIDMMRLPADVKHENENENERMQKLLSNELQRVFCIVLGHS